MAVAPDLASRLTPDLETARALVPESNVVPVALRYTDDVETPVSALLKLRQGGPASCSNRPSAVRSGATRSSGSVPIG